VWAWQYLRVKIVKYVWSIALLRFSGCWMYKDYNVDIWLRATLRVRVGVEYVWSLILLRFPRCWVYKYVRATTHYEQAFRVEIQVYLIKMAVSFTTYLTLYMSMLIGRYVLKCSKYFFISINFRSYDLIISWIVTFNLTVFVAIWEFIPMLSTIFWAR
jgi:hypothetical protein